MASGVFRAETGKSISAFIKALGKTMALRGFIIHNEDKTEMVYHFGHHGVELAEGFDLNMVQVCSPRQSAQVLKENLERAVLLPKFIVVFHQRWQNSSTGSFSGENWLRSSWMMQSFPNWTKPNTIICASL